MTDINMVAMTGRVTKDAVLRKMKDGTSVATFALATSRYARDGEQWVEKSQFFACALVGRQADSVAQWLVKGRPVSVQGSLRQDVWADRQGERHERILVSVDRLVLGSQGNKQSAGVQAQSPQVKAAAETFQGTTVETFDDDEIPF